MKYYLLVLLLFFAPPKSKALHIHSQSSPSSQVMIKVSNIGPHPKGKLFIAIFEDPQSFPQGNPKWSKIIPVSKYKILDSKKEISFSFNLPPGRFSLSVFLDENGNQKLDKNFLGIPKEKFGFSQNPPIRRGPPDFEECSFNVIDHEYQELEIELVKIL